jgi:hypothetical protein
MSTNYYVNVHGEPPGIHIGKSSAGWVFVFNAASGLDTLDAWKPLLKEGRITDEYAREIGYEEMMGIILNRGRHEFKHNEEWLRRNRAVVGPGNLALPMDTFVHECDAELTIAFLSADFS